MRELADAERIDRLMRALGERAEPGTRIFLVGGATAVMLGWRQTTIDVDLVMAPESESVLRAVPEIKEALQVNVELASPLDFIPVPDGWEERGRFISDQGGAAFYHFDLIAQALAKAERAHTQDVEDVEAMLAAGLVEPDAVRDYFARIEPELWRFPAIDPAAFQRSVEELFGAS